MQTINFRDLLTQQEQELTTARTVEQVKTITSCPGSLTGFFWSGNYDDFADALMVAGWQLDFREDFWFTAVPADGLGAIEYIEGNIVPLDSRFEAGMYLGERQ